MKNSNECSPSSGEDVFEFIIDVNSMLISEERSLKEKSHAAKVPSLDF
jgi:hypothetical protein